MRLGTAAIACAVLAGCTTRSAAPVPAGVVRHVGPVTAAALEPGSGRVLALSRSGLLAHAEPAPGAPVPDVGVVVWRPTSAGMRAVGFAVDEHRIALVGGRPGRDGVLVVGATRAGFRERRLAADLLTDVAFDRRGDVWVACRDGRVLRVAGDEDEPVEVYRHAGDARGVAADPNGAIVASVGLDHGVVLHAAGAGRVRREAPGHVAGVDCVAFAADGSTLASGARDGRVRVHDRDGALVRSFEPLGSPVLSIASAVEGAWIAGLADGRVVRLTPGEPPRVVEIGPGAVQAVLVDRRGVRVRVP